MSLPILCRRGALVAALASICLAAPARAFDKNRIKDCFKPPARGESRGAECVGKLIDDATNEGANRFKGDVDKLKQERENIKKELEQARKQAAEAGKKVVSAIPGAPPELVKAAECVKSKASAGFFGVPLIEAAKHPEKLVRAALSRFDGVARSALANARSAVHAPSGAFAVSASSDKGFEANLRLQPGKLDVNAFIDALLNGMEKMRQVDPVAECLIPLLRQQAAVLKRHFVSHQRSTSSRPARAHAGSATGGAARRSPCERIARTAASAPAAMAPSVSSGAFFGSQCATKSVS